MGELIFVLVIVVQGIAGVVAAVNKKKRAREAALKGTTPEAAAKAKAQAKASGKAATPSTSGQPNALTARLEKARAASARKGPSAIKPQAAKAPQQASQPSEPTPASASVTKQGGFDARLARRREQIAQLRAIAQGSAPPTAPPVPAPPRPAAPAPATSLPRSAATPPPAAPPSLTRNVAARPPKPRVAKATPVEGSEFTPTKGVRAGKKARGVRRRRGLNQLLGSRSDLKRAIILKELLDPPVSLRQDSGSGS